MDEAICSIESDKATLEISAPKAGKLKILAQEGSVVKIGDKVAEVDESASAGVAPSKTDDRPVAKEEAKPAAAATSSDSSKNFPSPAAGKILAEKGIEKKIIITRVVDMDGAIKMIILGNILMKKLKKFFLN